MERQRERGYGNIAWAAADPSAKDGRLTLRQHCGIPATFRRLGGRGGRGSERQAGIEQIRRLLGNRNGMQEDPAQPGGCPLPVACSQPSPRLYVDPRCVNTIREFNLYRYPEQGESIAAPEEPEKANDHCMDALRYAVAVWFSRASERRLLRERRKGLPPFRTAKAKLMERVRGARSPG